MTANGEFFAGAAVEDISPREFPAPVNGSMAGRFADEVSDPMHAKSLALSDGSHEIILCVIDACMVPREICEEAKRQVTEETGVPAANLLISATHTHSAAAMTPVFQSDPDPGYVKEVPTRIARSLIQAHENLEPAEVGWGFSSDPTQVFNRRWRVKEQEQYENPFGVLTDRAWMNPGNINPKVSVPAGPVDADVAVLAARSKEDGRPLGLLANYSLHYVGGVVPISADYFGMFDEEMRQRLKADDERYEGRPGFVGIMSNGTSGDINNINFGSSIRFRRNPGEQARIVARSVAAAAIHAFEAIQWSDAVSTDSAETELMLGVRKPSGPELLQAGAWLEEFKVDAAGNYRDRRAIYARESTLLAEYPDQVPVKLQVHRVGNLSIGAIPCEVFVEIGLSLKRSTPFTRHFTISLANGYNGYLPTEEQHELGGYETWRARSSYLEVRASGRILDAMEILMRQLEERADEAR
jgi:hypothetical protein